VVKGSFALNPFNSNILSTRGDVVVSSAINQWAEVDNIQDVETIAPVQPMTIVSTSANG